METEEPDRKPDELRAADVGQAERVVFRDGGGEVGVPPQALIAACDFSACNTCFSL